MAHLQNALKLKNLERSVAAGDANCKKQQHDLDKMSDDAINDRYEKNMREAQKAADLLNGVTKSVLIGASSRGGNEPLPSELLHRGRYEFNGNSIQVKNKAIRNGSTTPMFQICFESNRRSMKHGN